MRSIASMEIELLINELFTYTNENIAVRSLTVVEGEAIEDKRWGNLVGRWISTFAGGLRCREFESHT